MDLLAQRSGIAVEVLREVHDPRETVVQCIREPAGDSRTEEAGPQDRVRQSLQLIGLRHPRLLLRSPRRLPGRSGIHLSIPDPARRYTERMSSAFLTDRYELTMLAASLSDGTASRPSVFELFSRRLSGGRRFGVVAGTGRLLSLLRDFRFGDDELRFLRDHDVVDGSALAYLESYRFTGTIRGYREGELYFPGSPILTVEGSFADAVVLETLALSVLN